MSVYRCNECGTYFDEDSIIDIKPDTGSFHKDCMTDDFEKLSEKDIIEELNELVKQGEL